MKLRHLLLPIMFGCGLLAAVSTVSVFHGSQNSASAQSGGVDAFGDPLPGGAGGVPEDSSKVDLKERFSAMLAGGDGAHSAHPLAGLSVAEARLDQAVSHLWRQFSPTAPTPSPVELRAGLALLRPELEKHFLESLNAVAEFKKIAAQLKIPWNDAFLENLQESPAPEQYPAFKAARTRALQTRQIAQRLQVRFASDSLKLAKLEPASLRARAPASAEDLRPLLSEMRQQATAFHISVAQLEALAARLNVTLDERGFTDSKFESRLNALPGFAEARSRMFRRRASMQAAESNYLSALAGTGGQR